MLKIDVTREGHQYFPKLFRSLSVKKGRPYTLSFRVRQVKGNAGVVLGMAVADEVNGWRSLGVHQTLSVGPEWKKFSYAFTAGDDSESAQFQLTRFKLGAYELDDLSFQSGADSAFNEDANLEGSSVPVVKLAGYAPSEAVRDFYQFLVDTEHNYWVGMSDYLKNELGVKSVIPAPNWATARPSSRRSWTTWTTTPIGATRVR